MATRAISDSCENVCQSKVVGSTVRSRSGIPIKNTTDAAVVNTYVGRVRCMPDC